MKPMDTTPEAAAVQTAVHRRVGMGGRLQLAVEISDLVRACAGAGSRLRRGESAGPALTTDSAEQPRGDREGDVSVRHLFERIRAALETAAVPYMLTGSFASSVHGAPRATQDIAIVIAPSHEQLVALITLFPEGQYYVSRDAALDALAHPEQFYVIDTATGWKVDFIIRRPRAFSREEFERRRTVDLDGVALDVASAEDVLIAKLEWAKRGSSDRQIDDAAGIIRIQGERLDVTYVQRWVAALGLGEQWEQAQAQAI